MQSPIVFPDVYEEELSEENMALRNEDRVWVKAEIAEAIDSLKPHGWRKVIFLFREWGILAVIIGGTITLLGITIASVYRSVSDVREEATFRAEEKEFRTQTQKTLEAIQATLRTLQASQSPKKILQELATLNSQQFVQNLPALRKVMEQPPRQVAPSDSVLRESQPNYRAAIKILRTTGPRFFDSFSSQAKACLQTYPRPGNQLLAWST